MVEISLGDIFTYQRGQQSNPLVDMIAALVGELDIGSPFLDSLALAPINVCGDPTGVDLSGFAGFIRTISDGDCSPDINPTGDHFLVTAGESVTSIIVHGTEHFAHRIVLDAIRQAICMGLFDSDSFTLAGRVIPGNNAIGDKILLTASSQDANMPIPAELLALGLTRAVRTLNTSNLFGNESRIVV